MYLKTRAIITKIRDFSENDLLIDLFTLKSGKVTVIAKGAKNAKSKISGSANLFVYGEFDLYIGKKWNRINSLEIIESFYPLREDIEKLSYGSYFLELTNASIVKNKSDKQLFILLLKTLEALKSADPLMLKIVFEFKLMESIGFIPRVFECAKCSGPLEKNIGFNVEYGGVLCHKCNTPESMNVSIKILKILQYFATNDFYDIMEIDIHTTFLKKIDILLYKYLCYYLEKNDFKSLKFLNLFKEDLK